MKTHNELFRVGSKVDAYLLFRQTTKSRWSFNKYVDTMIKFHG